MQALKRSILILGGGIVSLGVLVVLASLVMSHFLVDIWWFSALSYDFYFWQRLLYRYLIFSGVTLLFFLIFWLNFWVASGYLGTSPPPTVPGLKPMSLQAYKHLARLFRTGSMWVYTPLSLALAILIALPLFQEWETFLLFLFGQPTGTVDPVYGKDIAYYLFSFPIYTLLQRRLLIAFLLLFLGLLLLYWLERRLLSQQDEHLPRGAKWHLHVLFALIVLTEVWHYILERYDLLFTGSHEPLFYGPGYVEMNVILPLIWLALLFFVGTSTSLVVVLHRRTRRNLLLFIGLFLCFGLVLWTRYSSYLPNLIQEYYVKPNAISREKPFIENTIHATLTAFELTDIEVRNFDPQRVPEEIDSERMRNTLFNIPLWDGEMLQTVYEQLQEFRSYYDFSSVDVNHYTVNGHNQQVFLAARELNVKKIPAEARNWINEHLTYTHGYGAVMTPAAQSGKEALSWFLRGIPLESDCGIKVKQPGIYYGHIQEDNYVIAPNDAGEFDYPQGTANVLADYQGVGGVPISSLFRKLIFASYFEDSNIFFTVKTNQNSKILFRRNVQERIRTLTPFLVLDKDPYLVVTAGRLYWVQDAYTISNRYPNAQMYVIKGRPINYVRDSVKVIVDAYDGQVDYYISDPKDPLILAYHRIYPGMFKSQDRMPPELAPHIRYPQDYFNLQLEVYSKYHQTDPEVFYQQEDVMEFAVMSRDSKEPPSFKSYYLTLDLIEPGNFNFLLLSPMSPKGRSNLRALVLAGSQHPHFGKMVVYNFPKGELIYGPSQVYALINQDTSISAEFTLWNQYGSQVQLGRMVILPIGKMLIYIQPVYLISSKETNIPELKRVIMSQGQVVVMGSSLEEAYAMLESRLKAGPDRLDKRFAPAPQPPPAPTSASPRNISPTAVPPGAEGTGPPVAQPPSGGPPPQSAPDTKVEGQTLGIPQ